MDATDRGTTHTAVQLNLRTGIRIEIGSIISVLGEETHQHIYQLGYIHVDGPLEQ